MRAGDRCLLQEWEEGRKRAEFWCPSAVPPGQPRWPAKSSAGALQRCQHPEVSLGAVAELGKETGVCQISAQNGVRSSLGHPQSPQILPLYVLYIPNSLKSSETQKEKYFCKSKGKNYFKNIFQSLDNSVSLPDRQTAVKTGSAAVE